MWELLRRNNFFLFDVYLFILVLGYGIYTLTTSLLVQDKLCHNVYNQSRFFCINLNNRTIFNDIELVTVQKEILAEAALFVNYK